MLTLFALTAVFNYHKATCTLNRGGGEYRIASTSNLNRLFASGAKNMRPNTDCSILRLFLKIRLLKGFYLFFYPK